MIKKQQLRWVIWPFAALALFSGVAIASNSDLAKEKRWEKQIVPDLFTGEAVKLKAGDVEFLALYTESATEPAHGGVIIMHGIGVHPAWPDVIEPLRTRLPELGWHTLSLQMPILENQFDEEKDYQPVFDEVPGRIQAGVDFLKSKGINNIVVSGHSMGFAMGAYYMANNPDPAVHAFAIVSGGPGYPPDPRMNTLALMNKVTVPVLDMSGTMDSDNVKASTAARAKNLSGKDSYTQVKVEGANHFYQGKEDALVNTVADWLNKVVAPQ